MTSEVAKRGARAASARAAFRELMEAKGHVVDNARAAVAGLFAPKTIVTRHQAEARPLLRFEDIPLELSDLRLVVRQTADIMRRFDALDDADYQQVQHLGRDMTLVEVIGRWYRAGAEKHSAAISTVPAPARRNCTR